MATAGAVHGPRLAVGLLIHAGSSWRKVWMPLYSPCAVGASILAPDAAVPSWYPSARWDRRAGGLADGQDDVARVRRAGDHGQRVAGRRAQVGGQVPGHR